MLDVTRRSLASRNWPISVSTFKLVDGGDTRFSSERSCWVFAGDLLDDLRLDMMQTSDAWTRRGHRRLAQRLTPSTATGLPVRSPSYPRSASPITIASSLISNVRSSLLWALAR